MPLVRADDQQRPEAAKPPRLPKVRAQDKRNRGACCVPEALLVAGDDLETILARIDIVVMRGSAGARVHPIGINSFELMLEADFLRCLEVQRGVAEFQFATTWCDGQRIA